MASAYVQSKSVIAASSSSPTVTLTNPPAAGNVLVAFIWCGGTEATIDITGWSKGTQQSNVNVACRAFWKVSDGSEQTVTGSLTTGRAYGMVVMELSGVDVLTPEIGENSSANASGTRTTGSTTPTSGKPGHVVCFRGNKANSTASAESVTGSNVGAVNEREDANSGSPTVGIAAWEASITLTSGAYSSAWTDSSNAANAGAIVVLQDRQPADTGLTITDSVASLRLRPVTDTGLTVTDSVASQRVRALTDTGLTITDSIVATRSGISISTTGLSLSDSIASLRLRLLTDTGLTVSDTASRGGMASLTDTGLTLTDSIRRSATHVITDTGATITDSIAAVRGRSISDTGLAITATAAIRVLRPLSDLGLNINDSLDGQHGVAQWDYTPVINVGRVLVDTGATITDTLTKSGAHIQLTDTGLAVADSIQKRATHLLADTGLSVAESVAVGSVRFRSIADTGLAVTDSISASQGTQTSLADQGVTITDALRLALGRRLTDTGTTITDAIGVSEALQLVDTGLNVSDSLGSLRARLLADTALTVTDSISAVSAVGIFGVTTGVTAAVAQSSGEVVAIGRTEGIVKQAGT